MPKVAVCIPTYNQSAYLPLSIESACSQTYPDVEVWVSDDASTDETETAARGLTARFPQLRYFRQERNLGISANNNWLLAQPETDFIVRLDSDDLLAPTYIERLMALMEKHSSAGYAHCAVREIDKHGQTGRLRQLGMRPEYQTPEDAIHAGRTGYRVAANICLFRGELIRRLQFYRQGMNFAEDWDLSVRIADAGFGNIYCSDELAFYRVWNDANNVRAKRKLDELAGCRILYDETLAAAYQKRGWDQSELQEARQKSAVNHSMALTSKVFTSDERAQLIEALRLLGGCPALERRISLYAAGLGPLLSWQKRMQVKARDMAKSVLSRGAAGS